MYIFPLVKFANPSNSARQELSLAFAGVRLIYHHTKFCQFYVGLGSLYILYIQLYEMYCHPNDSSYLYEIEFSMPKLSLYVHIV